MPGFGFEDDELKKLFAEAGEVVKKAKVSPSETPAAQPPAAPAAPPPVAPAAPPPAPVVPPVLARVPEAPPPPPPQSTPASAMPPPPPPAAPPLGDAEDDFQVQPMQKPAAPASADGTVRLGGGELTDAALIARSTGGSTVSIPWGQIKNLSLARVIDRNILAFVFQGTLYYFNDENVAYKGLLKQLQATLTMNWRQLVNEIASHVADKSDPGIQAVTGGGGMVPKFLDMGAFFNAVRSR